MLKCCPVAWTLAVLVALAVRSALCVPVEVVYTGEGCDCPTSLDYRINVPRVERPQKYTPSEYGYKVDVPAPAKAKVTYSFDFVVEEPRTPRPEKPTKWNLYAKVDRIAVNRGDCEDSYAPSARAPAPCSCGQCGVTRPPYRYVYKRVQPCRCQRLGCRCNAARRPSANSILKSGLGSTRPQPGRRSPRRKRDLHRAFLRKRKPSNARPVRYTKLYLKSLPAKRHAFLPLSLPLDGFAMRTKIVKRDIKGEYDLLEQEREQMDLTLPEIIQFMPETLRSDFKRGPCSKGCFCHRQSQSQSQSSASKESEDEARKDAQPKSPEKSAEDDREVVAEVEDKAGREAQEESLFYVREGSSKNTIASPGSTYAKRNAADFHHQGLPQSYSPPQMPPFVQPPPPPRPTDPAYGPTVYSASGPTTPQYVYDRLGHKYLHNNGRLWLLGAAASVPDTMGIDTTPLQYAGDLEAPAGAGRGPESGEDPMLGATRYPVLPISNADLDKVISDIVYRHPDFIEATSHYGGGLVDPEPLQEQQTKDFLRKLIEGRLNLWFGDDEVSDYGPTPDFDYEYGHGYGPRSPYGSPQQPYHPMQGYFAPRDQP